MTIRVLSIQSHVVHGYVGNRSAVFPLQVLGIEVDHINSVQFSNHTGYTTFTGQSLNADDLKTLYSGLKANGLIKHTHVLTGYVGRADFLEAVVDIVKDMKASCPDVKYFCDPVLGDSGELYVPAELIPIYREKVLPLADVILPNQFEAELLTSCKIMDEATALDCIHALHSRFHVPTVVISSTDIRPLNQPDNVMLGFASRLRTSGVRGGDIDHHDRSASSHPGNKCYEQVRLIIPRLNGEFRGTGDLFSALTLARLENHVDTECSNLQNCFQLVLRSMQAILRRTLALRSSSAVSGQSTVMNYADLELKLIQSIDDIRNPPGTDSHVQVITPNC